MSHKNWHLLQILTILVTLAMLSACAPAPAPAATQAPAPTQAAAPTQAPAATQAPATKPVKAAVLLEGPLADTGWNTSSWEALQELGKKYGWEVSYQDNVETEDMEDLLRGYGEKGFDIVFGPGWLFAEPMTKIAAEFPKTTWVNVNENQKATPNFSSNGWVTGEMAYFMGQVAGELSKTKKLAMISGTESPLATYDFEVLKGQAQKVDPKFEAVISYVGSWQDPAKAKELAKANIEAGNDVILSVAGSGDFGVFEAIKEAEAAGKHIMFIGWTGDMCQYLPNNTLASIVQLPGFLLRLSGEEYATGKLKPGYSVYSVKNGAQSISWCGSNVPADLQKKVNGMLQDYMDGKLDVPVRTDL